MRETAFAFLCSVFRRRRGIVVCVARRVNLVEPVGGVQRRICTALGVLRVAAALCLGVFRLGAL